MGGFGAGAGMASGGGGGGLGAGGAVFVQSGGTLTFTSGTISADSVAGGAGGSGASGGSGGAGQGLGGGIFIENYDTNLTAGSVSLAPGAGQTITVNDVIAAGGNSGSNPFVTVNGPGTVVLNAAAAADLVIRYGATVIETGNLSNSGALSVGGTLILAEQTDSNVSAALSGAPHIGDGFADVVEKTGTATLSFTHPFALLGAFDVDAGTVVLASGTTMLFGLSYAGNLIGDLNGGGVVSLQAGAQLALGFTGVATAEAASVGVTDFTGNITGDGTVITQGGGTQTLAGSNAGSLVIDSGSALLLSDSGTQFGDGVTDNGTLIVDSSGTITLGPISGSGSIVIENGALALAGDLSSFTGTILDETQLVLAPTGTTTFTGAVSGAGSLLFAGSGMLTLDESLPITGGVTLQTGTLELGGALPTLGSGIVDNATLVFDETGNATESQSINGNGTIVHASSSTLTLTGLGSWDGVFVVNAGAVSLLPGVVLHVTDLVGSGGTILLNGGTLLAAAIDPGFGDSILGPGALAVGDNATFNNRKTIPGVVFGNNDTLVNAQGTVGFSSAALVGGDLVAGSGAVVQNGGSIAGAVNIGSGSITNMQGGGTLSTGVIQNGVSASGQLSLTNGGTIGGAVTAGDDSNVAILAGINAGAGVVDGNVVAGTGLVLSNGGLIAGSVSMLNGTVANLHDLTTLGEYGNNSATAGFIQSGVTSVGSLTLTNGGTLHGGVTLGSGTIINQGGTYNYRRVAPVPPALIAYVGSSSSAGQIYGGVTATGALSLTNYGTITGVVALGSGTITNVYGWYDSSPDLSRGYRKAGVLENGISASGSLVFTNSGTLLNGVTLGSGSVTLLVSAFGGAYPSYFGGGVTASGALSLTNKATLHGGVTAGANSYIYNLFDEGISPGTIVGRVVLSGGDDTVINGGTITNGVTLLQGGTVNDIGTGYISSVTVNGAGQVSNSNTIGTVWVGNGATLINHFLVDDATIGTGGVLVNFSNRTIGNLYDFGTATNNGLLRTSATVAAGASLNNTGIAYNVVDAGSVVNSELLHGVSIAAGGTLTNTVGGEMFAMQDAGTVINYGGLFYGGNDVLAGGVLINKISGTIPDTLPQTGLTDAGTIINDGSLQNVVIDGGAALSNSSTGFLLHSNDGGALQNAGTVLAVTISGAGATLTNLGSGDAALLTVSNGARVVNQGTLGQATVQSGSTLVLSPTGTAAGISISGDGSSTLELQAGQGTLGALYDNFLGFGTLRLDAGATWTGTGALLAQGRDFAPTTITGPGTLVVSGPLVGSAIRNSATLDGAIYLDGNPGSPVGTGFLTNTASGVINGVVTDYDGSIDNAGSIAAVHLNGYLTNEIGGTLGSVIAVGNTGGLAAPPLITNFGTISGGVTGLIGTLSNSGSIAGGVGVGKGTRAKDVDNSGTINGIYIGGLQTSVTNEAGGVIVGNLGYYVNYGDSTSNTLINRGRITGSVSGSNVIHVGAYYGNTSTLINSGTIQGAVQVSSRQVINQSGGVIGAIVDANYAHQTITNAGTILGNVAFGAYSTLHNAAGGTIDGMVQMQGHRTLVQEGTILGAINLSSNNSKVILAPTAINTGIISGNATDTLELEAGTGTLNSVVNFGTIVFDTGAYWSIGSDVTLAAGTLIGASTLTIAGALTDFQSGTVAIDVLPGATLANPAGVHLTGSISDSGLVSNAGYLKNLTLSNGSVTNLSTGTIANALTLGDAGDSLSNAGTLLQSVMLTGAGAALANTGKVLGAVTASGTSETIVNGGSIVGAVSLTGSNDVLQLSPGAQFGAGATGNSSATLIFAAGNGTLSGLRSSITGFGSYTAQSGALWSLTGSTSIAGSFALSGPGSLSVAGSLDNTGTISGNVEVGSGGTLVNHTGALIANGLTDAGSLIDAGAINGIVSLNSGGLLSVTAGGTVGGMIGNANGIDLSLAGTVTGAVNLQGSGNTVALSAGYVVGSTTLAAPTTIELTASGGTLAGGVALLGHGVQLDGGAAWRDNENGSNAGRLSVTGNGSLALAGNMTLGSGVTVGVGVMLAVAGTETGTASVAAGAATLIDAGTILGGVTLAGAGDVLALKPGATIAGAISAGTGAILELQAGSGTLHSLYGFTTIVPDAGADWTLDIPAISQSVTFNGAGTIVSTELTGTAGVNNSATLDASLSVGTVENYGVILGGITAAGAIDNRGSIGAGITLTGSGGIYNHVAATVSGGLHATGDGETIVDWGIISGQVSLSGHNDTVELIGPGTYAGGSFVGGVTGATDGSSTFYLAARNLDLSSLTLGDFSNYANVPNLSIAGGITLNIVMLDRNETFNGSGTLGVLYLSDGTLTNNGYMLPGILLSNSGHLINRPGATLATYNSPDPTAGPQIRNEITGNQTITNFGTMSGISITGAGGVVELGSNGIFTQNVYGYRSFNPSTGTTNYGSTLRLLTGSGSISSFGDSQFARYAPTYAFNNFNTIDVATGGTWSLGGDPRIANSLLVSGAGTLNLAQGAVVAHGEYFNFGAVGLGITPQYYLTGYLDVAGRVTNSGVLQGNVTLGGTGGFLNLAGSKLTGTIDVIGTAETVGNLGTMQGGVALYGGDRLILGAAASFGGAVTGGTGANTLEIASGPFSLSNFNAPGFAQFSKLQIDAGVSVTQDASDTLANIALVNYGTLVLGAGFTAQSNLTNGGMLTGDVTLSNGVQVTNVAGGTISGNGLAVIESEGGPASVFNAGIIDPATYGVYLPAGGSVTNAAGGTIEGTSIGVLIKGGAGTVVTAGTIAGDGGTAVSLAAGFGNRVVLDAGASFSGIVDGGNAIGGGAVSTLELDSASSVGMLSGIGSTLTDFAAVTIDSSARWTLSGSNSLAVGGTISNAGTLSLANATLTDSGTLLNNGGVVLDSSTMFAGSLLGTGSVTLQAGATLEVGGSIASGETIVFGGLGATLLLDTPGDVAGSVTGFVQGETIELAGIAPGSVSYNAGQLAFNLPGGGTSQFALGLVAGSSLQPAASDGSGGAELTALCFVAGSLIRTPGGDMPVEKLAVGDTVNLWGGGTRPITWIGVGHVLATRGRRNAATPVIVRKGALADNVPARDLYVTKGHSLFIDDVLIPVEFLVNHRSIVWDDRAQEVTLYHVELDRHDVMVANGAPAESYRDDGNRWLFQNANSGWDLPAQEPCAPVLTGGPIVDAVWRRLLDRSGVRPGLPLTDDPDLHLLVDGVRVDGARSNDGYYTFRLQQRPLEVRVMSRAGKPDELGLARDSRSLGVALEHVRLWQGRAVRVLDAADAGLAEGFHPFEPDNGFRWTDGDAVLPAALFAAVAGPCTLELLVRGAMRYPPDAAGVGAQRAAA